MKRALVTAAIVAAAACSSREKGYSTAPAETAEEASVIQPSELSPEQVRVVQRALADRGFAVELTGEYDSSTRSALTAFQRARGLPATGNLNSPTVEALGIDPSDVTPVRRGESTGATPGGGY
jgi:peptidoglycan hydrolase-like protein with peptidoglycan-binding domain